LAVEAGGRALLVDCSGTPVQSLRRAGLEWAWVHDVVLTHGHLDHLYGLVSLAHELWVTSLEDGVKRSLTVHGPEAAIAMASALVAAAGLSERGGLGISFSAHPLAEHEITLGDLRVTTFPVDHGRVPALGVKVCPMGSVERSVVFSGDTALCEAVMEQSRGVPLLLHECTTYTKSLPGHTSLAEIEELAARTTAERVVLVHLPPVGPVEEGRVRRRLRASFGGRVQLGDDGAFWVL
jgi:ribonuclease BN (tRNA processing enzyme)